MLPPSLQMQMEWKECVRNHGNIKIIINGYCRDARAVMANSALLIYGLPAGSHRRSHSHTQRQTHTHIRYKAVCVSFIQIHFALILQFG